MTVTVTVGWKSAVVRTDNHQRNVGGLFCDLVVPDKRNTLSSPAADSRPTSPDPTVFIPRPTKWGRGVLASPRMSVRLARRQAVRPAVLRPSVRPVSGCPHFVSGVELGNPCMDFFNFWHTHPLGSVDVPFGVFEILPVQLADHRP